MGFTCVSYTCSVNRTRNSFEVEKKLRNATPIRKNDTKVNPMNLSLGQAAKETNLSKSTISRAIKEGRLSANKNDNGSYSIDPSELFRVYPPKSNTTVDATEKLDTTQLIDYSSINGLQKEIDMLRERLRDKDQHIDTLSSQIEDVQQERDKWHQQVIKKDVRLEDMRSEEEKLKSALEAAQKPLEAPKRFLGIFPRKKS